MIRDASLVLDLITSSFAVVYLGKLVFSSALGRINPFEKRSLLDQRIAEKFS